MDDIISANGIDVDTGQYASDRMTVDELDEATVHPNLESDRAQLEQVRRMLEGQ
jgi:hypothetical protein